MVPFVFLLSINSTVILFNFAHTAQIFLLVTKCHAVHTTVLINAVQQIHQKKKKNVQVLH